MRYIYKGVVKTSWL